MLLFGFQTFEKNIVPSFNSIAIRERETKAWVQKIIVQPQSSENNKENKLLAQQVMDLETQSARSSRWLLVFAIALFTPMVIVFPVLLIWVVPRNYRLLQGKYYQPRRHYFPQSMALDCQAWLRHGRWQSDRDCSTHPRTPACRRQALDPVFTTKPEARVYMPP